MRRRLPSLPTPHPHLLTPSSSRGCPHESALQQARLRDIKIDPRTSRFLPDAEDESNEDGQGFNHQAPPAYPAPEALLTAETHVNGETPRSPRSPNQRLPQPNDHATSRAGQRLRRRRRNWSPTRPSLTPPPRRWPCPPSRTISGWTARSRSSAPRPGRSRFSASRPSRPSAVAGTIAGVVRENGRAEVQATGPEPPIRRSKPWPSPATTCAKPGSRRSACRPSSTSPSRTRTDRYPPGRRALLVEGVGLRGCRQAQGCKGGGDADLRPAPPGGEGRHPRSAAAPPHMIDPPYPQHGVGRFALAE